MDWKVASALKEEFDNLLTSRLDDDIVIRCVELIRLIGEDDGDDERAHGMEKDLWEAVLRQLSVSSGLAFQASKTKGIKFSRWFA